MEEHNITTADLKEYFDYLDMLRLSGVTNMFGAVPYLTDEFPDLDKRGARVVLTEWMRTFSERHGKGDE
jgi:hypothetical protein